MNTDKLFGMIARDPEHMRNAMYAVVDKLQDQPEVQLQATAICLYAMCRATDVDIRRLLTSVERMRYDLESPFNSTFKALEAYAREQIGRRG